jgi:DNA-binding NtrC family response regulator
LQVLTLALPPLRERRDELESLALALAPAGNRISRAALRTIEQYDWPGNVRELKNTLWRAALLADGAEIQPRHLSLPELAGPAAPTPVTLADAERAAITDALALTGGNRVHAAQRLGIARSTLLEKIKRLGIEEPRSSRD